jgi:hypothetical protein
MRDCLGCTDRSVPNNTPISTVSSSSSGVFLSFVSSLGVVSCVYTMRALFGGPRLTFSGVGLRSIDSSRAFGCRVFSSSSRSSLLFCAFEDCVIDDARSRNAVGLVWPGELAAAELRPNPNPNGEGACATGRGWKPMLGWRTLAIMDDAE